MNLDKIIDIVRKHKLNEMMTVGAGGIAGTVEAGDDPPVGKKKKKEKKAQVKVDENYAGSDFLEDSN